MYFSIFVVILILFGSFRVKSLSLVDMALEFRPNLDLHIISNEFENGRWSLVAGNYYASIYNKDKDVQKNSSAPPLQNQNNMDNNLRNFFPSSKPQLLTSGENLIPVKSLMRTTTVEETIQIISQMSSSQLIKNISIFPSIVVIWPVPVPTIDEATVILNSEEFQSAFKSGFNIASEVIFGFLKTELTEYQENKAETEMISLSDEIILFEVFNINNRQVATHLKDGVVDFYCRNCRGVAIRRNNFQGITLNVSGMEDPELNDDLHFETTRAGDLIFSDDGFSYRILQILQSSLNFSVKAMKAVDWGKSVGNKWIGSVADVADGKADLGIAITTFRPSRAKLISFLPPADESVVSAYFRNPDLNAVRDIFARPFHVDLWAAVFSTWIVLAFFMILFSVIRKRYDLHNSSGQQEFNPEDSFIWALATACQQGWDEHPVAGSLRTIFLSGSFTGVVAYAGYSAAIVSTLSLRVDPIRTPQELLKSSLQIGIRQGFINELLQQNNTNDIMTSYQQKLKATKESHRTLNIHDGYNHLVKHQYAFISTRDNIYDHLKVTSNNITDSEICSLKEMQILKHGFPSGHFTARNSPFKEFFRYIYVSIREPGISWKLRANYTYKRRCLEATDNSGNALGPNDVFTAFMILSGGYFLSFVFLFTEKLLRIGKTFSYIR